jgi:DNA polymerase III epsilon subunit-like protein
MPKSKRSSSTSSWVAPEIEIHPLLWVDSMLKPVCDGFPRKYVTWDIETTGFDKSDDLITELGYTLVENCEAVYYENHILDWTRSKYVERDWLYDKIKRVKYAFEKQGKTYNCSIARMQKYGQKPEEVLETHRKLLLEYVTKGYALIGHNHLRFDIERLDIACREFLGESFVPDLKLVLDTKGLEFAVQALRYPLAGEALPDFMRRVTYTSQKGVFTALHDLCVDKYEFDQTYELDMRDAHSAGFDSLLTHYLFEEHRKQIPA